MTVQYLSIALGVVFAVGWIIPLALGIKQLRHHHGPAGVILTVIGALWALPAIAALVMATLYYTTFRKYSEVHNFDPTHQSGPCATVIIPWQGQATLEYSYGGKRYISESGNGQFAVPAGRLTPPSFTAYSTPDKQGWQARSTLYGKEGLTLAPKEQRTVTAGPPYAAKVTWRESAGKATMSLEIKDAGGYSASLSDPGRKSPPRFEVLDQAGQVVWQGNFAYG